MTALIIVIVPVFRSQRVDSNDLFLLSNSGLLGEERKSSWFKHYTTTKNVPLQEKSNEHDQPAMNQLTSEKLSLVVVIRDVFLSHSC